MVKKICVVLVFVLLVCLSCAGWAEGEVNLEVITVDGASVVVLTPQETMLRASRLMLRAREPVEKQGDFVLPQYLTLIEEGAFEGIAAECVKVSEAVVSIEARAFANCGSLREIHIPATVVAVDDLALEGCENVTVYGATGSEAERFAQAAGFAFVDPNAEAEEPGNASGREEAPVELPPVKR